MERGRFVYGVHAVTAALRYEADNIRNLWLNRQQRNPRLATIYSQARQLNIEPQRVSRDELDRLSGDARHQGVIAELMQAPPSYTEQDLERVLSRNTTVPLLLILDGIQDPHNLGACLRTADAAGVDAILAPSDRAVGLTSTVRKVACGAAETVPFIQVINLARILRSLRDRGLWLIGTSNDAEIELYKADLSGPIAILFGAEEKGLRRLTREHCDQLVRIPMAGSVSSLNVSVAAGVVLFEAVRQRHQCIT